MVSTHKAPVSVGLLRAVFRTKNLMSSPSARRPPQTVEQSESLAARQGLLLPFAGSASDRTAHARATGYGTIVEEVRSAVCSLTGGVNGRRSERSIHGVGFYVHKKSTGQSRRPVPWNPRCFPRVRGPSARSIGGRTRIQSEPEVGIPIPGESACGRVLSRLPSSRQQDPRLLME